MKHFKLPKITTVTDLRYKTADIMSDMKKNGSTYAILRDSEYAAILVTPELYEKAMTAVDTLNDLLDTKILEQEIDNSKSDKGIDFEKYIEQKMGKNYVQNHLKKKTSKISRNTSTKN